jgi:glycosyltransferase involved in cell wall biosynthesis
MVTLSIVVPCYNEEEVLPETAHRLGELFDDLISRQKISARSRVYFVDDGSRDRTWPLIESLSRSRHYIAGIKLSRNRGHQNALLAGLFAAEGDAVISIDADLQDDLGAIYPMIEAFEAGNDIVFGVRRARSTDTLFKRVTAVTYYRLLRAMGVDLVLDHADYRLMSRRAVDALAGYGEVGLFVRGIIPQLGFRSTCVTYDRAERFAGVSKYPLGRMLALAWDGITSFSVVPLRIVTIAGGLISMVSFLIALWALGVRLLSTRAVPGWASIVLPITFLGGIQLLGMGIIGEYVGKIYLECKRRPRYFIEEILNGGTGVALPVGASASQGDFAPPVGGARPLGRRGIER